MEDVYEQFFYLKYLGGWSFTEAYNLPVGLRKWFVLRLVRQLEDEKSAIDGSSKGSSSSRSQTLTPENQPKGPPTSPYNVAKKAR